MSVYVDPLLVWPTPIQCFKDGSCHLFADTVAELHEFAGKLGLKREWFQDDPGLPHYDLTAARRVAAVKAGAQELTRKEAVNKWRTLRSARWQKKLLATEGHR